MKKLISFLLCLSLVLSLGVLPALAAEDAAPAADGDSSANVFFYECFVDKASGEYWRELLSQEHVDVGGHPSSVPVASQGMSYDWYTNPDLSDSPVDPASYTIASETDVLTFYGYRDTNGSSSSTDSSSANVFYYTVRPQMGADDKVELTYAELVTVGGHPSYNPASYTWHTSADLSGSPVDPASYTIASESDTLTFYGYQDSVIITMHMPAGYTVDIFGQQVANRGGYFDPDDELTVLPTGCWAAGWADASGHLFDAANTPLTGDIDLYALEGNFRVTYKVGKQFAGGEGFLSAGTPKHAPTSFLEVSFDANGHMDQRRYDIVGWQDENGQSVDVSTVTIAADRTLFAVLDGSGQVVGAEDDWNFDWSLYKDVLTVGGAETLEPVGSLPDGSWPAPWSIYADDIRTVSVSDGVREIKSGFLCDIPNVVTIELPATIERVGHDVFLSSPKLEEVSVWGPEDCDLAGWMDDNGDVFDLSEICSGTEFFGDLTPVWFRSWVEGRFTDVSETVWYHDAVQFCYQAAIMNGMSETIFGPNGSATRAQVVTVLWRLAGEPEGGGSTFSDVPAGKYYSDAVAWAADVGVTTGYPDDTFHPDSPVTRQDFLTFLFRYTEAWAGEQPSSCDSDPLADFADRDKVGSWAQEAECWSVAAGFQQGSPQNGALYLNPTQSIKRSEMAAFLMRYCIAVIYADSDVAS